MNTALLRAWLEQSERQRRKRLANAAAVFVLALAMAAMWVEALVSAWGAP